MDTPSTSQTNSSGDNEMSSQWLTLRVREMSFPINIIRKHYMRNYKRNRTMAWLQLLQILANTVNSRLSLETWSVLDSTTIRTTFHENVVNELSEDTSDHESQRFKLNTCFLVNSICQRKSMKRSKLFRRIITVLKRYADVISPDSLRNIGIMTLVTIMTGLAQKIQRPLDYVRKWHLIPRVHKIARSRRFTVYFNDLFEHVYQPIQQYLSLPNEIRMICFDALKFWIETFPFGFTNNKYLPYVIHGLTDTCPEIRLGCIRLLQSMAEDLPDIVDDGHRIINTVLKVLGDENKNTVLEAITLIFKLHERFNISLETKFDYHDVAKALYSNNIAIRQAGMNLTVKLLFKDLSADTIANDVLSFYKHAQDNGKSEQLIDSLFEYLNEKMIIDRIMDHLLIPLDEELLREPEIEMPYIEFVIGFVKRATKIPCNTASYVKYSRKMKTILNASLPLLMEKYAYNWEMLQKIESIQTYL